MSLLQYEHEKHKQRRHRLWNPPRRPISATPIAAPASVASQPAAAVVVPDFQEEREQRLYDLKRELKEVSRKLRGEIDALHPVPDVKPQRPTIHAVLSTTAGYYGVSIADIFSDRRTQNVVRPRQIGMYLAKEITMRSLPEIGRRFGGKDHTTVLHAVRKIRALRETDEKLNAEIEKLITLLDAPKAD